MIQSAVIKLTLAYLSIIMFMSICFSMYLYHISDRELNKGLRRPSAVVFRETSIYGFEDFRSVRLSEGRTNLKQKLLLLNVVTLIAGFIVSFVLARKTLEPIEKSLESQKRFTADASHELKTPLTVMQTEIEVALRDDDLSKEEAINLLKSNLEEVSKLKMLSDNLLKLAQQDAKDIPMKLTNVKIICQGAISEVQKSANQKQITIINHVGNYKVNANIESMTELFVIILNNAIKFSAKKSNILLSSSERDNKVVVSIKDNGIGINNNDLQNIFDRFFQADKSRNKKTKEGYGLGLSIAKKIAAIHDAIIDVNSKPGEGTTFYIIIPVRKNDEKHGF